MRSTSILNKEKYRFAKRIEDIESKHNISILLAYVRGSQMYGTAIETSDVDISFVYQQPTDEILKTNYVPYIDIDGKGNIVGYEIQRYIELLGLNNPNILESLDIPQDCIIYKDESMDVFIQDDWLSKLTEKTFLGYADSQIKKSKGLNKHMNRVDVNKKDLIDFCYIIEGVNTIPFRKWSAEKEKDLSISSIEKTSGLVKLPHGKGLFGLYLDVFEDMNFRGILKDRDSTQLRLSSIPKEYTESPYLMYYNQDGYEAWNKEYISYNKWLSERNEERFKMNKEAGQNVDLKNVSHLFRLLEMCENISLGKGIITRSENVQYLKEIREGMYNYDELIVKSEKYFAKIKENFSRINLQEKPDIEFGKQLLLNFRKNG